MANRVAFTGKQSLSVESFDAERSLQSGEIRVQGICSLMSTGTENIVYNRIFEEGSHWDQWVKYPFHPGYANIGEVTECASDVSGVCVGQRVAYRQGHASAGIVKTEDAMVVPEGLDPELAVWFALSKITYVGAQKADYQLGDNVLIVGGGPIGQMSVRWAMANGVNKVVMVDPLASRLALAKRAGAHVVIDKPLQEIGHYGAGEFDGDPMGGHGQGADSVEMIDPLVAAFGGERPDVIIDSTGAAPVLALCLERCKSHGKVIVLGDTGTPTAQHLTKDVITRGVKVIGAHDGYCETTKPSYLFWQMLSDGRINMDGMNTHHFDLADAQQAYDLVNTQRGSTMGVVFRLHEPALV